MLPEVYRVCDDGIHKVATLEGWVHRVPQIMISRPEMLSWLSPDVHVSSFPPQPGNPNDMPVFQRLLHSQCLGWIHHLLQLHLHKAAKSMGGRHGQEEGQHTKPGPHG